MAGHSHWKQIKQQKGVTDQKRGKLFSKLLIAVSVAAKADPNPLFNPRLKAAVEKARAANIPNENIERAIKRSVEEKNLEEFAIEAYGPEGVAILIEGATDNKNRSIAEIRALLAEYETKMANPGSVRWLFETKGESGELTAKFPHQLTPPAYQKLGALQEALDDRGDIQRVITNAEPS